MRIIHAKRIMALVLTAALALTQPTSVLATGTGESVSSDPPSSTEGFSWTDIKKPQTTSAGVSTWDCIWFGEYWQEDTNGDGHCFSEDTTVTKNTDGYLVNQDGVYIYNDNITVGSYPADTKQPIKWRVLDVDEEGNALLLSDKLVDIECYNRYQRSITWENSTLRSFLNSYSSTSNTYGLDYSTTGFFNNAFSKAEKNVIQISEVVNDDNPVYGASGGNNTNDKIFCLSMDEALTAKYGFVKNVLSRTKYYTDEDATRKAVVTSYTYDKEPFESNDAGTAGLWWLRSPGLYSDNASTVDDNGAVHANNGYVCGGNVCVRPAFHMNLLSSASLWSHAGTVCSDGTVEEIEPGAMPGMESVTGVSVTPKEKTIKVGGTVALSAEVSPDNATDKTVSWTSSKDEVAEVDEDGLVTGIKPGTATITVTTTDGSYTDTCEVAVIEKELEPEPEPVIPEKPKTDKEIDVDDADLNFTMLPGEVRRLNLNKTGKFLYGVSYVSSNKKIVSVKNGIVTAKKAGMATVTASYCGMNIQFTITVDGSAPDTMFIEKTKKKVKITAPKTLKMIVGTKKTVSVKIPSSLRDEKYVVTYEIKTKGVIREDMKDDRSKPAKAVYTIDPMDAGATYIVWSMKDESMHETRAVTKIIVKKPIDLVSINKVESGLNLEVGEGKRLAITTTKGNTDAKNLSFSVKGRGVKVSKSGYVVATMPNADAKVTVKYGEFTDTIDVKSSAYIGDYFSLNKTSVNAKKPKSGGKTRTLSLKLSVPKKNPPAVVWGIIGEPGGLAIDPTTGKISVDSTASPGCYTVTASADGYNTAHCELVVK